MWRHDYALGAASVTNRTWETHELISPEDLARSDYAHWLLSSAGVERRIGGSTDLGDQVVAGWAFHMPKGMARDPGERREFDFLAPHLRNLLRLTSQFGDLHSRNCALEQVIDAQGHAVLLLAGDGTVCWASAAFMRLCAQGDGLACRKDRLVFARQADNRAFDDLLRRAAAPDAITEGGALGRLTVARPSGAYPYVLELSPAPMQFGKQLHARGMFLLSIRDAGATVDPRPERWAVLFGLTRTEARVAALTMRGLPDATIAAELGVGIGTVHSHQKQLLAKTGTRSKAEAAHLLTRLS